MSIALEDAGARIYITGNSFPIKDSIKSAGGHWDGDRKAWWIGKAKRSAIEAAIAKASSTPAAAPANTTVQGKVEYKGKPYYVCAIMATGEKLKLTVLDESISFWADASACTWTKRYQKREERGNYGRGTGRFYWPTLSGIRDFVKEAKANDAGTSGAPTKVCWECGCLFTQFDARKSGGDWQDSYCGC